MPTRTRTPSSSRIPARILGRGAVVGTLIAVVAVAGPTAEAAVAQEVDTVLALTDAKTLLRQRSPGYRAALAQADASAEGVIQSWGSFLPRVTASASFSRNDFTNRTFLDPTGVSMELPDPVESTSKSASQSLSLSWTAFDGGRRLFDLNASRARARAADLSAAARLVTLESDLEGRYFEALKQQELLRLAEDLVAARERDLQVARERFRIAAVARTDVLQAEVQVGQQRLSALRAEQQAEAARRELSELLDIDESVAYELTDTVSVFDPRRLHVERLLDLGRRSHPDLARLEASIRAESQSLWSARGSWWPQVNLNFSLGRSEQLGPEGDLFTFDPRNTATNFSLSLSWNVLNGLQKKYETGQAAARLSQTRHERRARELQLEKEIRNAYDELVTAYRSVELQQRNAELAREAVRVATERYRIGATGYVELQQATTQATEAERGLIEARYEFMKTFARLKGAVGRDIEIPE